MRRSTIATILLPLIIAGAGCAVATEPQGDAERGRSLVEANCAGCHATGLTDESPYPPAPPMRTIKDRANIDNLGEAFAEGILVGHHGDKPMPEFTLEPQQIEDLIAYLKSFEVPPN